MTPPKRKPADEAEPRGDTATVIVTLERATGKVTVDQSFSTPAETSTMLAYAHDCAVELVDEANGRERARDDE